VTGYTSQSYFLLGCGLETLLAEVNPDATQRYLELTRQVKLLTLPSEMGERFKAMALSRGIEIPLRGFSLFDERGRL
jgi:SAM-dependent MidA family methyltransferase